MLDNYKIAFSFILLAFCHENIFYAKNQYVKLTKSQRLEFYFQAFFYFRLKNFKEVLKNFFVLKKVFYLCTIKSTRQMFD